MMRTLGFTELTGIIPAWILAEASGEGTKVPSTATAAGCSGDIIAHRDEEGFDFATIDLREADQPARSRPLAATTSGDIIGHSSPIRSADLDWSLKGRVIDKKTGTVLEYSNPEGNPIHDQPAKYGAYRNSGDIIANTDFRHETERKMFYSKKPGRSYGAPSQIY